MKYSLEAVFHRKIKKLIITKGQQGYIMGAFRAACCELGVDFAKEPDEVPTVFPAAEPGESLIAKALAELKCIHGSPVNASCDYCRELEKARRDGIV